MPTCAGGSSGRSAAAGRPPSPGFPGIPATFFFGAADGGVWKTTDAGVTWRPIFERAAASSIGALTIAPSDPQRDLGRHRAGASALGRRLRGGTLPLDRRRRHLDAGRTRRQPACRQDLGRSRERRGRHRRRARAPLRTGRRARALPHRRRRQELDPGALPRRRYRGGGDRRRSGASGAALRGALAGATPPLAGLLPADRGARERRLQLDRWRAQLGSDRSLRLARGRSRPDRARRGAGERRARRSGRRSPARGSSPRATAARPGRW